MKSENAGLRRILIAAIAALLLVGSGASGIINTHASFAGGKHKPTPTPRPTSTATTIPTATATPTPTSTSHTIKTVFLIVMENHNWSQIQGSASAPYINSLLTRSDASYATQYYNPPSLHPSEPNYVWLEAAGNTGLPNANTGGTVSFTNTPGAQTETTTFTGTPTVRNSMTASSITGP